MKKRIKKNKIPAYEFGMDQIQGMSSLAQLLGTGIQAASDETSGANIAGSTISGLGTGAAAGAMFGPIGAGIGAAVGGISGAIKGIFNKKAIEEQERREETSKLTQYGMNTAANAAQEYYSKNGVAYTFENGGILPDLAYVDNNEILRSVDGNFVKVPNTTNGTDQHLIDASNLESVLSDKIKRPGTKRTFAQEGKKLLDMTKPSKGKDKFAENTNRLNKINANKAYEALLAEQESVKMSKGVKPKVKGIPAYENGKGKTVPQVMSDMNKETYSKYGDFFDEINSALLPYSTKFLEAVGYFPNRIFKPLLNSNISEAAKKAKQPMSEEAIKGNTFVAKKPAKSNIISDTVWDTYVNPQNTTKRIPSAWATAIEPAAGPAPGRAYKFKGNNDTGVDAYTYANDLPIYVGSNAASPVVKETVSETKPKATPATSTKSTRSAKTVDLPEAPVLYAPLSDVWQSPLKVMPVAKPKTMPKVDPTATANASNKSTTPTYNNFNADLLSLTPVLYNFIQSIRKPEIESTVTNPYSGTIRSTLAKRRANINDVLESNRRNRAISNYNLSQLNTNTGSNLAARTQAAVANAAADAAVYTQASNINNQYLGDYANMLNNLGQQFVQSQILTNDLNARNRASARNFGASTASQIGKWSQVNTQMNNQYNRDMMLLPFLEDFLREGYTKERVDELYNRTKNRT